MSPYRVVVAVADGKLVVMQAMHYYNAPSDTRGVLILERIMPEISGPLTLDQMVEESYVMSSETNSLVADGYLIVPDIRLPQKYGCVHTSHTSDSSSYVLPARYNLIAECQRACMLDYVKKHDYLIVRTI